jgi:hypothetical protein
LHDELEKMQPKLVQLATDTDDNDDSIGEILKTNDTCETVLKRYKRLVDEGNSFNTNLPIDDALVSLSGGDSYTSDSNSNENSLSNKNALDELKDLFSISNLNHNSAVSPTKQPANSLASFYDELLLPVSQSDTQKPIMSHLNFNNIPNNNISTLQPEVLKPKLSEISRNYFIFDLTHLFYHLINECVFI